MDDEAEKVVTDNERFYDEEVAPILAKLGKEMENRGMGFVAVVEYNPEDFGSTFTLPPKKSDLLKSVFYAARTNGNIDSYMMAWMKDLRENKRAHGSIFLKQAGLEPDPSKRL